MRHRVITEAGEEFYVESLSTKTARQEVELRDDEIKEVVSDPEPITYYEERSDVDPRDYLTISNWISEAVPTDVIIDWEKWFADFQLGFYVRTEDMDDVSYEPSEDEALIFPCSVDGYDFVRMGDGNPEGVGKLTYLSFKMTEHRIGHRPNEEPVQCMYVTASFENNLEDGLI